MREGRSARAVVAMVLGVVSIAGACASLQLRSEAALRSLERAHCAPLRVVDRYGKLLREVPGDCAPYGRARWTRLADVPPIVAQLVVESEDRRFRLHPGVDPLAISRAAWSNLGARRVVSGASTLTMQLARLLEAVPASDRTRDGENSKRERSSTAPEFERGATEDVTDRLQRRSYTSPRATKVATDSLATRSQTATAVAIEPRVSNVAPWGKKLSRAWTAFAIELRLSKDAILEAYLNLAYYGAGAYGIDAAARAYFGKPVAALSDAESSLLAMLPRAPAAYDLRRGSNRAAQRRDRILTRLVQHGELDATQRDAIATGPIQVAMRANAAESHAGHFVDYVLAQLSASARPVGGELRTANDLDPRAQLPTPTRHTGGELRTSLFDPLAHPPTSARHTGGELRTTLDLDLQTTLERIVAEHVASIADRDVDQAGLIVLDADTGAIRAMVGSRSYDASQVNITLRRRQLGSLLKPFVYALAIERGESAASIALDVGDVSAEYRARDWVGREAGPLSFKEALAGSYNLAAIHTLERVGVAALHARLRSAGVAELAAPPARYGLMLALGSARVRLLDVASGYGFLVRGGTVRPAHAIERLEQNDRIWAPTLPSDRAVFSPAVSWQVMDMLSDAAARHRRFGFGLPLEAGLLHEAANPVAAKTGTASGLSDASAILATREFIVAAWTGRFDGQPTHGTSGMWAAAPLASRGLVAALGGKAGSLPARPADVPPHDVAALSGRTLDLTPPPELQAWAERARARAGRTRESTAR